MGYTMPEKPSAIAHLNLASGDLSSVSGGFQNTATGYHASISGGFENVATGDSSSVSEPDSYSY